MKRSKPLQLHTNKSFKVPRYDKFSRGTQVSTHGKNVFCQTQNMPVSATGTQTSRITHNCGVQTQQLHVVSKFVQTSNENFSTVLSNQQGSCTCNFCSCNQKKYLLQDLDNLVGLVADSNQWDKPFVMSLIENFLFALKLSGRENEKFLTMCCKAIAEKKLLPNSPLYNLLLDQFNFLCLENTSSMRYSFSTKCIFKVAKGLFGGAALRFLSGFKNENQVRKGMCGPGYFDPVEASVILAIPSESVLDKFHPLKFELPKRIKPGVMFDFIDICVNSMPSTSSLVLKFDGRRIRPGFEGDDIGDIDLGGFETSSAVSENLHFIDEKIICVKYIVQNLRAENVSLQNPNSRSMKELLPDLFSTLDLLNKVALLSRQHKEGMDRRLIRYQNLAGKDWIKTKYKKIISYLSALSRKTSEILVNSLDIRNTLSSFISKLQGSDSFWTDNSSVPLLSIRNCHILKENNLPVPDTTECEDVHLPIKQRSSTWHSLRSKFMVTGSTLGDAAGFNGLSSRRALYDNVHFGKSLPPTSVEVQKAMSHGTTNELNAVATICTKVLPVFFPQLDFVEVGVFRNPSYTSSHSHVDGKCTSVSDPKEFSLFSLDGVFIPRKSSFLELNTSEIEMCTEIKCPYFRKSPHLFVPQRYVPQLQSGLSVTNCDKILFVSFTDDITTVFLCPRNEEFFHDIMEHVKDTFVEGKRTIQSKVFNSLKDQSCILSKSAQFLTEVKSVKLSHMGSFTNQLCSPDSLYQTSCDRCELYGVNTFSLSDVENILIKSLEILKDTRQVLRQRATESVTFMLSNSDRFSTNDRGHGIQIGYVLSGSSFPEKDVRNVVNGFYKSCIEKKAPVVALAFDGQHHSLMNNSNDQKPLTVFKLQKNCWNTVKKKSKSELLKYIIDTVKETSNYQSSRTRQGIHLSCPSFYSGLVLDKSIFSSNTMSMKENKNVSFDDEQAETVNEAVRETEIQNDSDVDISVMETVDETLNEIEIESDEDILMAELYVESLLQDGKQALDDREVSEGLENIPIDPEGNHASEFPDHDIIEYFLNGMHED